MAALCTGNSYGLSNLKANDNKELIFVKLTDSAFRAIEEYSRNKVSDFVLVARALCDCCATWCTYSTPLGRPPVQSPGRVWDEIA